MPRKTARPGRQSRRTPKSNLDDMIAEATVDCYNESEQACGLYAMIEDNLAMPFSTAVLGVNVIVERVDLTEADEIVVVCCCGRKRQRIPILDLPLPNPEPSGSDWIEAYRRWARGR